MIVKVTPGNILCEFTLEMSEGARAKARELVTAAFPSVAPHMKDDGILTLLIVHALGQKPPAYTLDQLVADVTEDNRHDEQS